MRCWACWEDGTKLIRPCRGCKDPELQYIHKACFLKFLSHSPPRKEYHCTRCLFPYDLEVSIEFSLRRFICKYKMLFILMGFLWFIVIATTAVFFIFVETMGSTDYVLLSFYLVISVTVTIGLIGVTRKDKSRYQVTKIKLSPNIAAESEFENVPV